MGPPQDKNQLTSEEEESWRNRCWFNAAICQDDHRLVVEYTRLRLWLFTRGEFMSDRFLRRIHVWLEVLQANFRLRGMKVTTTVTVAYLPHTEG
jgi:hypothetical protein